MLKFCGPFNLRGCNQRLQVMDMSNKQTSLVSWAAMQLCGVDARRVHHEKQAWNSEFHGMVDKFKDMKLGEYNIIREALNGLDSLCASIEEYDNGKVFYCSYEVSSVME
jgi:hypothetical protein